MISDTVRFWSFFLILIPSILCSLFLLYHLLFDRALRRALNNHIIAVLLSICLISEVTIYPWMLYYYQRKGAWERSLLFCAIWGFLDWLLYVAHTMLFGWATIERHILIFRDGCVSTEKKRFLVHYLPIILLVLYLFIFYIVMYFFPPCENRLLPSELLCIFPCLYDSYTISMWDFIANQIVPIFTITVFSIGLLVRVLWQKRRMHLTIHWRKHRNMVVQALSISLLYLTVLFPYAVIFILGRIHHLSSPLMTNLSTLTDFFCYFILPLFPLACIFSSPELRGRMKKIFHLRRQARRTSLTILTVRARGNNRTREH